MDGVVGAQPGEGGVGVCGRLRRQQIDVGSHGSCHSRSLARSAWTAGQASRRTGNGASSVLPGRPVVDGPFVQRAVDPVAQPVRLLVGEGPFQVT